MVQASFGSYIAVGKRDDKDSATCGIKLLTF